MATTSLPKINLKKLDAQHRSLVLATASAAADKITPAFSRFFANTYKGLTKAPDEIVEAVFMTVMQHLAEKATAPLMDQISRQVLARGAELYAGPLDVYKKPVRQEWVPVEILRLTPAIWRDNVPGQTLTMYCLAGHPSGHRLHKKVPMSWLNWLAYQIGFNRRTQFDSDEPHNLIGLRFWGFVVPQEEERPGIDFSEWNSDAQVKAYNSGIIAKRCRFERDDPQEVKDSGALAKHACPFNYDHYCLKCHRTVNDCEASPHRDQFSARRPVLDKSSSGNP